MTILNLGFRTLAIAAVASLTLVSAAVADDKKKNNTIKGAVVGAGVGALIGDGKGAAVGGVAGAIIGHNWK